MPFKLARLAPLFVLALATAGASAAGAHPRAACCCRPHAVRHHLTHVRTIVREKVIIDHIVEGPSEWRRAPEAPPPQEVQVSDLWLSGGVGPAYVGGGGGGGGFAYAQGSGTANAGAFARANAFAAAQASVSANIAVHVGIGGHGGHGCGCGKGGHW